MNKFFTPLLAGLLLLSLRPLSSETMPVDSPSSPGSAPAAGLPAKLELPRYAAMAKKSPFTLASTTQENAEFAKDLVLAGYMRLDNEDFVLVANRTRPDRILVGTKPSPQGFVLEKVERHASGDPTKLKARIRKGTESAELSYEAVASAPSPAPGIPGGVPPGAAPVPGQNPAAVAPPGANPAGQPAKSAPVIRRRVIPVPPPASR